MRYFFRRRIPPFDRVLLVESGSRFLLEDLIPGLYELYGDRLQLDVVTCYAGTPRGLGSTSRVYRVHDYRGRAGRARLVKELRANRYSILGLIADSTPVMYKWKLLLAARIPAKVFILNENGDYFWLDWGHWAALRQFLVFRSGLAGAGAARTLSRLLLFPFTLAYLLLYAALVHVRRKVRAR